MSSDISANELKVIQEKKGKYEEAKKKGFGPDTTLAAVEYHDAVISAILTGDLSIEPGCGVNPDPDNMHIKDGGWGGDTASAKTWDAVPMKDSTQWKIVDKSGINVAHKFATEVEAEAYIKYHVCMQEKGDLDNVTVNPGTLPPAPEPATVEAQGMYPYPAKGAVLNHTIRGPTVRHYASGAPDDMTIEANVKDIKFDNYQFVVDVTINKMEHDDNISTKLGGVHMGSGWFDNGVGIYTGKTCLGYEPHHPTTKLCVVKGPLIGDVRGKRIKVCSTYFKKTNKTELWTNQGQGWKKQVEAANVGNFNPKSAVNEAQLRIDGFIKGSTPTIHSATVTEI